MIDSFQDEYRFLSNFYPCTIQFNGLVFQSVEAAYQSQKTVDIEIQKRFCSLNPMKAKRLGRKTLIDRPFWEQKKVAIMYTLIKQKFSCHEELKEMLLNTGNARLVEGNHWGDIFWGVCNGEGQNMLGKILMNVRDILKGN